MRTCINLVVFLCSELFKFDFAAEFTLNMKQSGVWGYIVCWSNLAMCAKFSINAIGVIVTEIWFVMFYLIFFHFLVGTKFFYFWVKIISTKQKLSYTFHYFQ